MDLKKFTLTNYNSAREALQLINELAIPNIAIFILNDEKQLIGSLTDGDIRRGLLNGIGIEETVLKFMNSSPKLIVDGENNFLKVKEYKSKGLRFVPILDSNNRIEELLDLERLNSLIPADVVLMAGGEGKRLRPLTENIPKPLLKVGDKPIIEYNIDRLARVGIKNINLSVNYLGEQLETYFGNGRDKNLNIKYVKEDKPLGTIGSILLVEDFKHNDILVMNSDLLTNIDFTDFYQTFKSDNADMTVATISYSVDIPYAVLETDESQQVKSLKEKPRYTYYANAGIYLIKKNVLDFIPNNTFFDITDLMEKILQMGKKLTTFPINGYWLDIGKHEDFVKAQEDIKHLKL